MSEKMETSQAEVRTLDEIFEAEGDETMGMDPRKILEEAFGSGSAGTDEDELWGAIERWGTGFRGFLGVVAERTGVLIAGRSGGGKTTMARMMSLTVLGQPPSEVTPEVNTQQPWSNLREQAGSTFTALIDDLQKGRRGPWFFRACTEGRRIGSKQYGLSRPPISALGTVQTDDSEAAIDIIDRSVTNRALLLTVRWAPSIPASAGRVIEMTAKKPISSAYRPRWDINIRDHRLIDRLEAATEQWNSKVASDASDVVRIEEPTDQKHYGVTAVAASVERTSKLPFDPAELGGAPLEPAMEVCRRRASELAGALWRTVGRYCRPDDDDSRAETLAFTAIVNETAWQLQHETLRQQKLGSEARGGRVTKEVARTLKELNLKATITARVFRDRKSALREWAEAVLAEAESRLR